MKLRAVDSEREHNLDLAKRLITQHRNRHFRWNISAEEYIKLELASFREKRVDRDLLQKVRRMKRYGAER